ncbi:exodeoxyribonuclease V subunit gamma [Lysobacter firmicutimachus]|uniref:RecBCD enzyme subunit RecC n=1 Tax=Lysobacter firmicutimachus TaxID=1792846 RepID=A0ABU8D8P3_9GAMM
MPVRADFRLYHSNALDVLAGLLAQELRTPAPGRGLLEPDTILIPQVAMRRWLQATLAQAYGIAANLEFLTPGEFVRRALEANVPGEEDDLDAAAMRWRLYATLAQPAHWREPALAPLRAYLDGDDPLKAWSLAGELASLFEKYQAWRRDWLLAWDAGGERHDPQAALWRKVAAGRRYRARRIDDYLSRFGGDQALAPRGLPPRLFAFATLNVSPDVLRVIATQAHAGTLHFYLPTPTRKYWGDLSSYGERLRQLDAAGGVEAADEEENPLLQAWGAAGRDFMAVLGGYEVVHPSGEIAAYADPEDSRHDDPARDSLLQRLQRDLLHRRAPPLQPWRAEVERDDASLQVHACHTRLREVQVLHDQLQALLDPDSPQGRRFDPPLQPREIAVLAPDIDPYAPHIAAVFGGLAGRAGYIPYALADVSPLAAEPLAEVFLRLLALPVSRFGLSEILDLLATPAIAEQAGLDGAGLDRLRTWLLQAGARWGIDAAHRRRHDAPGDDAYTWAFALDRLLLGHAVGHDRDGRGELVAGIAPYAELEGASLDALDALIRLLRVLARHERALDAELSPAQWAERLLGLLRALLPERPRGGGDQRTLERLRSLIESFARDAALAGVETTVPAEVVRAHFRAALAEADTRAPLLTGGISFGRMVPMRLIPFRAICLLGMNDGDYPRRDPADGLNRLAAELGTAARRHGDRSLRDDDRFLFLQLFAAASDSFYLSYLGADPRDGSQREPSALVAELLDVAARYHADPAQARKALVVRQPLQPFAAAAFGAGEREGEREPRRFSYREEWRAAVDAGARGERAPIGPWLERPLAPAASEDEVAYAELRAFLRDPPTAFLRQRLGLRLPDRIEAEDDVEPLVLPGPGLFRQQLQQAVFDELLSGAGAVDRERLQAQLRARALLPSGPLGRRQLDALLGQVRPYADAFARWREGEPQTLDFAVDLDGRRLSGRLDALYRGGLARLRFDRVHGPAQIAHGLDWLVLSALGDARPLAQFAETDAGPGPHLRAPAPPAQARAALAALLRLRDYGLREPLPFLPRAGWLWYEAAMQDPQGWSEAGWNKAEGQWRGTPRSWGEASTPGAQLALRGRDPFADPELGEQFRAIARRVFGAVLLGRDEDAA